MKRIVALCFVLSMTLFACGSSDPTSSGNNGLVGPTWRYRGNNLDAETDLSYVRFHADNSYEYAFVGESARRGSWSIAGNALAITDADDDTEIFNRTYAISIGI